MKSFYQRIKRAVVSRPQLKTRIKKARYKFLSLLAFLFGPSIDTNPKILGYHTVDQEQDDLSITPTQFEEQLDWLQKNHFHIITLRQWWEMVRSGCKPAARTVILTFDDGFKGVSAYAAPLLAKRGLAATVFIVTDFIGRTNQYDHFLGTRETPMMTWDDVEFLNDLGWDIQSHSHRHYPHYELPEELRAKELTLSKDILEKRTGRSVEFFCYPYGAYDQAAPKAVALAGYVAAVTCRPGFLRNDLNQNPYLLPRLIVDGHQGLAGFITLFRKGNFLLHRIQNALTRRFARNTAEEFPFDEIKKFSTTLALS